MINILAKIFINNNLSEKETRRIYGILCGTVGIILNLILFIIKFTAGIISNSIAITADAFNNLSDSGSSLISIIGFKLSGKKPDKDHPFGHGRFEYISGMIVSMLILLMGFELAKSSVTNIFNPSELTFNKISVIILIISIITKLYMALYNFKIGKKIDSPTIKSTGIDSLSDTISTFAVLLSLLLYYFFEINIDAYFGLLVSIFILFAGFKAAKDTINPLLGLPPSKELVENISAIVLSHEEICGIHDLVVHDYGPGRLMISLHAEVPCNMDVLLAHDIIDNIEIELSEKLLCEAVIHMDPISHDDQHVNSVKEEIIKIISKIDPQLSIHDFRMVNGESHTNLIFDVVLPIGNQYNEKELLTEISTQVKTINKDFCCVIKFDYSYI